jgi:hypothetical protein
LHDSKLFFVSGKIHRIPEFTMENHPVDVANVGTFEKLMCRPIASTAAAPLSMLARMGLA